MTPRIIPVELFDLVVFGAMFIVQLFLAVMFGARTRRVPARSRSCRVSLSVVRRSLTRVGCPHRHRRRLFQTDPSGRNPASG